MAYMNQEKKARIKKLLDEKIKHYPIKYSLAVRNHSTIVLNISEGDIDFIGNYRQHLPADSHRLRSNDQYLDVNPYHFRNDFSGIALEILEAAMEALNLDNFDKSDIQSDYFHVGHYVDINIGKWDKPYTYRKQLEAA